MDEPERKKKGENLNNGAAMQIVLKRDALQLDSVRQQKGNESWVSV